MLKPEEAKKRLEAEKTPLEGRDTRIVQRVLGLPETLHPTAFALIRRDAMGKTLPQPAWNLPEAKRTAIQKQNDAIFKTAREHLDALTFPEREAIFTALRPKLGRALTLYWNPASGIYQRGHYRRAFRLHDHPELTSEARFNDIQTLIYQLNDYQEQDSIWLATWVGYIPYIADNIGRLLAAVMDGGGEEGEQVYSVLVASAKGEHEIGVMGRHVTRALLTASRVDGWEFMEKFLLAAQRNEGLRQNILEAIDEAHPQAFRRMLRLIVEHELMRFSATIRAVGIWFALGWDAPTLKQANAALNTAHDFMFDPEARETALATSEDGQTVYLALWAMAFEDALAAMPRAQALFTDPITVRRAAAVHLLQHLDLPQSREVLIPLMDDPELSIAAMVFQALNLHYYGYQAPDMDFGRTDLFERLERNLLRFPKEAKEVEPILFPWIKPIVARETAADALTRVIGKREPERLLPYVPHMGSGGREQVARLFSVLTPGKEARYRDILLGFLSDGSSIVRAEAIKGLKQHSADDPVIVAAYEKMLTRKSSETRRAVLDLLVLQRDENVLASADRLLDSKQETQRIAGLGLLESLKKAKRQTRVVAEKAKAFAAKRTNTTEGEKALLSVLLTDDTDRPTLDNALGLMDPEEISKATPLALPAVVPTLLSPTTPAIFQALNDWLEERRQVTVVVERGADPVEMLLGDVGYWFPAPNLKIPIEEDIARLPLAAELRTFWENRPKSLRDPDGFELIRATILSPGSDDYSYRDQLPRVINDISKELYPNIAAFKSRPDAKYFQTIYRLLAWLDRLYPTTNGAADFLLDATTTAFLRIAAHEIRVLAARETALAEEAIAAKSKSEETKTNSPLAGLLTAGASAIEKISQLVGSLTTSVQNDLMTGLNLRRNRRVARKRRRPRSVSGCERTSPVIGAMRGYFFAGIG
jgi:HEAT repeat protein